MSANTPLLLPSYSVEQRENDHCALAWLEGGKIAELWPGLGMEEEAWAVQLAVRLVAACYSRRDALDVPLNQDLLHPPV